MLSMLSIGLLHNKKGRYVFFHILLYGAYLSQDTCILKGAGVDMLHAF